MASNKQGIWVRLVDRYCQILARENQKIQNSRFRDMLFLFHVFHSIGRDAAKWKKLRYILVYHKNIMIRRGTIYDR